MQVKKPYVFLGAVAIGAALIWMQNGKSVDQPAEISLEEYAKMLEDKGMYDALSRLPYRSVSGNYLAARFAVSNDDLTAGNKFYGRALKSAAQQESEMILSERGLPVAIGAGDIKAALEIIQTIDWKKPTATGQLAVLVQLVEQFKQSDNEQIDTLLKSLRDDGFGRLLKPIFQAWNYVGEDQYARAITALESLVRNYPSLKPMVQMHLAFVYQVQGNVTEAEHYYKLAQLDHLSVRSAYLIGQFYETVGKKDEALKLYRDLAEKMPGSPFPKLVEARLEKGVLQKQNIIAKASDGVAAALYDVATVLYQENSYRLAILYAQLAHYLTPQDDFVSLLLGDIATATESYDLAEKYFRTVSEKSDMYILAQLRLAQIEERRKNFDEAVAILTRFTKNPLLDRQINMELGDLYRRKEDFAKAIPYYSNIINKIDTPSDIDWVVYFARGICYERNDQWDLAEKDLQESLKLSPQQPEVLNYLAYSWADHGKNLEQALAMLESALEGAPDDPYIADSVGWALHKNGRTEEAVPYLEGALYYLPDDTTVNDHLGDVYWHIGRRLEARFQWERALKNAKETDTKVIKSLKEKLENGIPEADILKLQQVYQENLRKQEQADDNQSDDNKKE